MKNRKRYCENALSTLVQLCTLMFTFSGSMKAKTSISTYYEVNHYEKDPSLKQYSFLGSQINRALLTIYLYNPRPNVTLGNISDEYWILMAIREHI